MRPDDILDAIGNADDECIKDAKIPETSLKSKRKSIIIKWGSIAACFCFVLFITFFSVYHIKNKTDNEDKSPSGSLPDTDSNTAFSDPTGLGLWKYAGTTGGKNNSAIFTRISPANISLSLKVTALENYTDTIANDTCSVLFGQYLSTLLAFDYQAHFAAYPEKLVEKEFTDQVKKHGLDFESALSSIDAVVGKAVGFNKFDVSYSVDHYSSYTPQSDGFYQLFETSEIFFDNAEINISEITEVRIFYFTDLCITFDQTYTMTGDPGLGLNEGFKFYKYQGRWYYWPDTIENDLSVDLALANNEDSVWLNEKTTRSQIVSIEGNYISLGDNKRYYSPETAGTLAVGDLVEITYRSLGVNISEADRDLKIYRAVSVEKLTVD